MPAYGPWVTRAPATLTLSATVFGGQSRAETAFHNTDFAALCESSFVSTPSPPVITQLTHVRAADGSFLQYQIEQFKIWWRLNPSLDLIPFRTGWVDPLSAAPQPADGVQTIDPLTGGIVEGEVAVNDGWITSAEFSAAFLLNEPNGVFHPQTKTLRLHQWAPSTFPPADPNDINDPANYTGVQVPGAELTSLIDVSALGVTNGSASVTDVPVSVEVGWGLQLTVAYKEQALHDAPVAGANTQSSFNELWGATARFSSATLRLHYQQPPWRYVYIATPPLRQRQRHTGTGAAYSAPLRQRRSLGDVDAPLRQRRTL